MASIRNVNDELIMSLCRATRAYREKGMDSAWIQAEFSRRVNHWDKLGPILRPLVQLIADEPQITDGQIQQILQEKHLRAGG